MLDGLILHTSTVVLLLLQFFITEREVVKHDDLIKKQVRASFKPQQQSVLQQTWDIDILHIMLGR